MFSVNRLPASRRSNAAASSRTGDKQTPTRGSPGQPLRFSGAGPSPRDGWKVYEDVGGAADNTEAMAMGSTLSAGRPRSTSLKLADADRFIPTRSPASPAAFHLLQPSSPAVPSMRKETRKRPFSEVCVNTAKEHDSKRFERVLRNELVPSPAKQPRTVPATPEPRFHTPPSSVFSFFPSSRLNSNDSLFDPSPLKLESQSQHGEPWAGPRSVAKVPFKVLDAPNLRDDFYVQALDWSANHGHLAVALGSAVWTFHAKGGTVTNICNLPSIGRLDAVTSVCWAEKSNLAVGTRKGPIEIYDTATKTRLRTLEGHKEKVGALGFSPSQNILTSGSSDRSIQHYDLRKPGGVISSSTSHTKEVCAVKWSPDGQLATGGNDDRLCIFKGIETRPIFTLRKGHTAAIKGLDYSPHQANLLVSGGGTADGKIRFWNTRDGKLLSEVSSGSQVCQVLWSRNSNELVSAHGFGRNRYIDRRLRLWRYGNASRPTECFASIPAHDDRVLHLALSPDGRSVASGSSDETLRFWNVFPPAPSTLPASSTSILDPTTLLR